MIIGSPKEIFKGENRIAMTPESAKQLQKLGYKCILESNAGINANFSDKTVLEFIEEAGDITKNPTVIKYTRQCINKNK